MDSFWTFLLLKSRQLGSLKRLGTIYQVCGATSQKNTEIYLFCTLKLQNSTTKLKPANTLFLFGTDCPRKSKLYLITLLPKAAVSLLSHNKVINYMMSQHDQMADLSIKAGTYETDSRSTF